MRNNYLEHFNDFEIPKFFLDKLKEFSEGGFILFYIGARGKVLKYSFADSEVASLGLLKAMERYKDKLDGYESSEEILKELGGAEDDY